MKFEPTDEQRRKVKTLAGFGLSQQQICHLMGIRSANTLRKHFRAELQHGQVEGLAKVQQTAFRLAASGRHPRMTIGWLERRAKWAPGMPSRAQTRKARNVRWVIEEYQPPVPDEEKEARLKLMSQLRQLQTPTPWDGDDPADYEEDDG